MSPLDPAAWVYPDKLNAMKNCAHCNWELATMPSDVDVGGRKAGHRLLSFSFSRQTEREVSEEATPPVYGNPSY